MLLVFLAPLFSWLSLGSCLLSVICRGSLTAAVITAAQIRREHACNNQPRRVSADSSRTFFSFFFFTVEDSLRCQVKGREAERSSLLLHYKPTHLSSHKCSSFFHLSNDGICFKQKSRSVFLGIINEFYSCMELKHQRVIHQAKMSTSLWF